MIPAVLVEVGLLAALGAIAWRCRKPRAVDVDDNGLDDDLDARLAAADEANRRHREGPR